MDKIIRSVQITGSRRLTSDEYSKKQRTVATDEKAPEQKKGDIHTSIQDKVEISTSDHSAPISDNGVEAEIHETTLSDDNLSEYETAYKTTGKLISKVEVFVATIASGLMILFKLLKIDCFNFMSSNTASITKSASLAASIPTNPLIKAIVLSFFASVIRPRFTRDA